MPSAILPVSIDSVPSLMACLIDSTCATSMSAAPDAASERNWDERPDKLTLASPPADAPAAPAPAVPAVLAAGAESPWRAFWTPPLGDDTLELVEESIFTIGFPRFSI